MLRARLSVHIGMRHWKRGPPCMDDVADVDVGRGSLGTRGAEIWRPQEASRAVGPAHARQQH
eukprot:scaffold2661_cov120-Isochrysis_galbana.AAC.8